jgi:hypothetical protein
VGDEPVPGDQEELKEDEPEWVAPERPLGVRLTGAAMRGLHRAIYGTQEEAVVVVADASGDPPSPDGLDLHLDPDHPEASTVTVRRWVGTTARGAEEVDRPGGEGAAGGGEGSGYP